MGATELVGEGHEHRGGLDDVVEEVEIGAGHRNPVPDDASGGEQPGGPLDPRGEVDVHDLDVLDLVPDCGDEGQPQPPVRPEPVDEEAHQPQHEGVEDQMHPLGVEGAEDPVGARRGPSQDVDLHHLDDVLDDVSTLGHDEHPEDRQPVVVAVRPDRLGPQQRQPREDPGRDDAPERPALEDPEPRAGGGRPDGREEDPSRDGLDPGGELGTGTPSRRPIPPTSCRLLPHGRLLPCRRTPPDPLPAAHPRLSPCRHPSVR